MSMEYIRRTYGVPAKRGTRVEYTACNGDVVTGVIAGSRNAHLRVKQDDGGSGLFHPTFNIKYCSPSEATDGAPK